MRTAADIELARICLRADFACAQIERAEDFLFLLSRRARAAGKKVRIGGRRSDSATDPFGREIVAHE